MNHKRNNFTRLNAANSAVLGIIGKAFFILWLALGFVGLALIAVPVLIFVGLVMLVARTAMAVVMAGKAPANIRFLS